MMKYLDHLEEVIITFLIGAATVVIFVAVVHRYLSGIPIPGLQDWLLTINMSWAQELCIYMFVWMAKFGAAYGVRTGIHVGVDVIVNRLPDSWRVKCVMLGIAGGALFTSLIGTLGARFVWENGMHYAVFNKLGMDIGELYRRTDHTGSGVADLDHLFSGSARLLPDVLPLPAGWLELLPHRRTAAS